MNKKDSERELICQSRSQPVVDHLLKTLPKVVIIVLNWNGKQDTLACLESLTKITYAHFEVIVVDNGSTDGSAEAILEHFPKFSLIENQENLGFAEGNNIGMRAALQRNTDLVLLLNNDTLATPDLLDRFVEMFDSCPEAAILGAKIYLYGQQQTLDHLGGMWNRKTGRFDFIGLRQEDRWQTPEELDYVCGAGIIIRRKVIETIGCFDPRFFLIWEESDYCFRARRAGFKIMTCPRAKIWHKGNASFVGGKPHSTYFWWRNRLLWIERNCSVGEKASLYIRILIPEIIQVLKIQFIKNIDLFFIGLFKLNKNTKQKKEKLAKNRAALCGIRDYFIRRFGKGPDWIEKT